MRTILRTLFVAAALTLSLFGTSALAAGGPGPIDDRPSTTTTTFTEPGQHFSVLIRAQNGRVIVLANCGTTYRRKPVTWDFGATDTKVAWMPFNGAYTKHGCEVIITTLLAAHGLANVGVVPNRP